MHISAGPASNIARTTACANGSALRFAGTFANSGFVLGGASVSVARGTGATVKVVTA